MKSFLRCLIFVLLACGSAHAQNVISGIDNPNASTSNSTTGSSTAANFISAGTKFTTTGACTFSSTTGGPTAGSLVTTTAGTCAFGVTLPAAPNGYACNANDETSGVRLNVVGDTTTSASFSGTTASGDKITFGCIGY